MTPGRRALIEILGKSDSPLSVVELQTALERRGLKVNKTTIYRELQFLCRENLAEVVQFTDRQKRYELMHNGSQHHHHVVCTRCGLVEEIGLVAVEKLLAPLEKRLASKINFKSVRHSLEFFGRCGGCQKKKL